ncbi:MAG: response regulator, partial [Mariprofundales bacterium]|nr:response regulator [Mariprofundales bacterium]
RSSDLEIAPISTKESWSRKGEHIYEFATPVRSEIAPSGESMLLNTGRAHQQIIGMIHVGLSNSSSQHATHQALMQGTITLLLLLLAALAATWWLADALTRQLQLIGDAARKVSQGDFQQRIAITGHDESATLAAVLNNMLDMLSERDSRLHAQQRIMQTILDQAPIGVWMLDRNRKIEFINHEATHIFAINEQPEIESDDYTTSLPAAASREFAASDHDCLTEGEVQHHTQELHDHSDGTMHSFDIIKAPVFNEQGEVEGLIGLAIDVSARLKAERERAAIQQQMEHTQRLESLGVLAGGIAHDFNNILTAIMGNAALAEHKIARGEADKCGKHMKNIAMSSEKAALLCRQMLAYSGRGHFIIKPLNLTSMVKGITSLLEVSIQRTIQLHYNMPEDLDLIEADEAQIQQVIMNLVINASDAIGNRSGNISITTGEIEVDTDYLNHAVAQSGRGLEAGKYILLEVSDDGCGMSRETQQKLFEPFFTTKFTGRGLGMSAVLGIVRGHRGALLLYSEVGRGTTFKVLFPATSGNAATPPPQPERQSTAEWRGEGTILIVDDEESIRESASAMLENMGFDTVTAKDGVEGVERYRQYQHDIVAVLLDMTMPNLDGAGCFEALRAIDPDVKVVLSSGYNEQDSTQRFASDGLAGFIQKPYWPEGLERTVRRILT